MRQNVTNVRAFVRSERGATMVEYALMLALIAIVCIAAVELVGTNANTVFTDAQLTLGLTT